MQDDKLKAVNMETKSDKKLQEELLSKKPAKKHVEKIVGKNVLIVRRSGCIPQGI